jgi:hypothetical protein
MARERIIFEGEPDNLIFASRASKWLLARPKQKDAILAYGEGAQEVVFYVKRNKASILIYQDTRSSAVVGSPKP